jgi:hypothetical protein
MNLRHKIFVGLIVLFGILPQHGRSQTGVPDELPAAQKTEFAKRKLELAQQSAALDERIGRFNQRCGSVPENSPLIGECEREQAAIKVAKANYRDAAALYERDLATASATPCAQRATEESAYSDLKQRVQTDQQIIRNFGFEQRADEIQDWADLGEQARKSYQEKAHRVLMDFALDSVVGRLKTGVASAPPLSRELSNRLVGMFRAAGLPDGDVAFQIAQKVGKTITPEQADILAGRIDNVKHAYDRSKDLNDLANSDGGIELARSVVAVAGWRNPGFALLAKDLDTVSLAIYATQYEKAKYQINKLTQLTETQLTELNDFTLRLRNDTAQLGDTVKALKSLPSCDSTTMIRK